MSEAQVVTMADGREVNFPGKRKMLKEVSVGEDGAVSVVLDFRNGETRSFAVPTDLMGKFAAHGASQKLGDEIAGLADIDDCVMAVDNLIERLNNGEWTMKRQGGNSMAGTSVLFRALVKYTGKTPEAIKEFLSAKTQAEKVALRNNPKIKPFVDEIEAEKAAKNSNVDTDAMLDELG